MIKSYIEDKHNNIMREDMTNKSDQLLLGTMAAAVVAARKITVNKTAIAVNVVRTVAVVIDKCILSSVSIVITAVTATRSILAYWLW